MTKDPLDPGQRAKNRGGGGLQRVGSPLFELADVVTYNSATHTSVLHTYSGRPLNDVPQMKSGAGEFEHLRTGTTVVVSYALGIPIIFGVVDLTGPGDSVIAPTDVTGLAGIGADNPIQPTQGSNNYRLPIAPTDLTQGDWARVGQQGNHVAVLEGGVSSLGSPTALVRSLGLAGLLQLIGQRIHTITDFGEWKTENNGGLTSFVLRAGSNQATQTGLDEQHWSIRIDLGATGDLFNFEITNPDGGTLFKFHVGPDGKVDIYGDAGVDLSSGPHGDGDTRQDIAGPRTNNVGGDDSLTVGGARNVQIGKSVTENIATDKTTSVGSTETRFVNSDQTLNVGGKQNEIVAGGAAQDAKSGDVARKTKILNGGWVIDIGNPADGANVSAQAAYSLKTSLGDQSFDSGGAFNVTAKQNIVMKSIGVKVGDATDKWPLFSTYRDGESQMDSKLESYFTTLQTLFTTAASTLTSITAPIAIPIVGGAIAAPLFTTAGTTMLSAAQIMGQVMAAIQAFEAAAQTYLSKKNTND